MIWPTYVPYTERLGELLPGGGLPRVAVEIPQTRADAVDLVWQLEQLFATDRRAWQAMYRQYASCDWFVLNLLLSGGRRVDWFTGRVEADCDFQFNYAREMQFDGDGVLDKSARGHFKSHWRNYVGLTSEIVKDPNLVAIIVAHSKTAAGRHGARTMLEWETNPELRLAFPDVFFADAPRESPLWSKENGCTVKRTMQAVLPSLSWWAIAEPPTGGRVGLFIVDDIENEATVETEDMRKKTTDRLVSFLETQGRAPRVWLNATHHHAQGVVAKIEHAKTWRIRCHTAEDTTQLPPDVAVLYDEAGGKWPDGSEIPPGVREESLDGMPVYLHGLELAQKRLQARTSSDGLASYYRQNMGDPFAGLKRELDVNLLRYYMETPEDRAEGAVLVATVDGSRGVSDPTFAMLWALKADHSISLVGAIRKRIPPSDFGAAMFQFWATWEGIARFDHFRVEIYGQAVYDWMITDYFERKKKWVSVVSIGRNIVNRVREYEALEPLLRHGQIYFPKGGILIDDEKGRRYDVVEYFKTQEMAPFPMLTRDDGIGSMALLGEPENAKKGILSLPYPEDDMTWLARQRTADHLERHRRAGSDDWADQNWWEN